MSERTLIGAFLFFILGACSSQNNYSSLPDIITFQSQPSDRFVVDLADVDDGHPFKGKNAVTPHTGAHAHFENATNKWPKNGSGPRNYPLIYAVADGTVDKVDTYFQQTGGTVRYGIQLALAQKNSAALFFYYSIEPMINPNNPDFYKSYIFVTEGQSVKKGDMIASLYLSPASSINLGAHIHFDLRNSGGSSFMAPAIFQSTIVDSFHSKWNLFGKDGSVNMPACMGYKIVAAENPFGLGDRDCL